MHPKEKAKQTKISTQFKTSICDTTENISTHAIGICG